MIYKEYALQVQVCKFLNKDYPTVLYLSDTIASCKLTKPQGNRNKAIQKHGFKTPDIIIFEPVGDFSGLFIELKTESPYLKGSMKLKKNEHIEAQENTMNQLRQKGYYCSFSWTFEQTKNIINNYLLTL